MSTQRACRFILEGDRFLISTHINSDGDAIGSALAMASMIKTLGKKARVVLQDNPIDRKYQFLEGFKDLENYNRRVHRGKTPRAIILDSPTISRIGDVADLLGPNSRVLNIDHHRSNAEFGEINLVDKSACATAEIIYCLARALKIHIDSVLATHLYTGIMFDTGRFRYSNLDRAFQVATTLVKSGADPEWAANAVYSQRTYKSVKVLGEALTSIRLHFKDRVAVMQLPYRALKNSNDLDGIVDYAISISGVEVAILLKEQEQGKIRASLRSRGNFDVNELAREFQGGGHPNAAGCFITGELDKAGRAILGAIKKRLKNRAEEVR